MKFIVEVMQVVEVELDETLFTEQFMEEFRQSFYYFRSLRDHVEHLAQLKARNLDRDFIEGYGKADEMGIKLEVLDVTVENYQEDLE